MPRWMRRRYLALRIMSEQPHNGKATMHAVWAATLKLFGEYGASQADLSLIEYDPQSSLLVIRCSHKTLQQVRASIASITEIDRKPATIYVVGVSGTLKALRKKVLSYTV